MHLMFWRGPHEGESCDVAGALEILTWILGKLQKGTIYGNYGNEKYQVFYNSDKATGKH